MRSLFILLFLGAGIAYGQDIKEKDVPAAVMASFKKDFPKAGEMEWEKEDTGYEVEFEEAEVEITATYDATGKLLESEKEIEQKELPASISEYIKTNLGGKKIKETSVMTDAAGTQTFEVQVEKTDFIFDEKGVFVKKVDKGKDKDKK